MLGILDRAGRPVPAAEPWAVDSLVREGLIDGRMLAEDRGLRPGAEGRRGSAQLVDGRVPHAVPMTLRAPHGVGTEIVL